MSASNFGDERLPDRFWSKCIPEPNSGCWLWLASLEAYGYGQISFGGRPRRAYQVAFEVLVGPRPDGLELDHKCRVRCCVNPAHLEPVTHAENMRRGNGGLHNAIKTHCAQGHPYDEENTRVARVLGTKSGRRRNCRECARESLRKHRENGRAA